MSPSCHRQQAVGATTDRRQTQPCAVPQTCKCPAGSSTTLRVWAAGKVSGYREGLKVRAHRRHAYAVEGAQTQPPKSHCTAPSHAHRHTCMYMRRHEQWVVRQATLQSSCVRTGCVAYQNPYHGAPKYLLYMAPSSAAHTPWAGQKICSSSARLVEGSEVTYTDRLAQFCTRAIESSRGATSCLKRVNSACGRVIMASGFSSLASK